MGTDLVIAPMVDGTLQVTADFFNQNIRDPLMLMLSPDTLILTKTDTQSVPAWPTWTAITWNNMVSDSDASVTPQWASAQPTMMVCRTPGWYEIDVNVPFQIDNATNMATLAVQVNGDTSRIYAGDSTPCTLGTWTYSANFATMLKLPNAGDYVEALVRTTRSVAGATNTTTGWNTPRAVFRRVRGI